MKVLLTSHGHLASGLVSSFEFIAGKTDRLLTLELDQNGIGSYQQSLNELLNQEKEAVLILADLKGGTPYNESFKYYLAHPQKVILISGLNLPMLLELVPQITANTTLKEAATITLKAGINSIVQAQDQTDEEEIEF